MEPLPDDIRRFLDGNIETIDQLEVLRVLGEKPDREWTAALLAAEVQASPQTVAAHVAALQGRGLLAVAPREAEPVARHGARRPSCNSSSADCCNSTASAPSP